MLNAQGARSVPIHAHGLDGRELKEVITETAEAIRWVGRSLDLHLDLDTWAKVLPTLRGLHYRYQTTFVADHLFSGWSTPLNDPRVVSVLGLVDEGILYVKISGCE